MGPGISCATLIMLNKQGNGKVQTRQSLSYSPRVDAHDVLHREVLVLRPVAGDLHAGTRQHSDPNLSGQHAGRITNRRGLGAALEEADEGGEQAVALDQPRVVVGRFVVAEGALLRSGVVL